MKNPWVRGVFLVVLTWSTAGWVPGQVTWWGSGAPHLDDPSFCYDPVRDRTVLFGGATIAPHITCELDASSPLWLWLQVSSTAPQRSRFHGGTAYDRVRQRVVCYDGMPGPPDFARTWLWDGSTWTVAATGSQLWFEHVIGHTGRGTVMAFGGAYFTGNDLREWNGSTWDVVPATVRPPRQTTNFRRVYLASAYDARRGKLVLFGTAEEMFGGGYVNVAPVIWEWDAGQGWVTRSVPFGAPMRYGAQMVFDSSRGTLIAVVESHRIFEWDGGAAWWELVPVTPILSSYGWDTLTHGHDSRRGYTFVNFRDSNNQGAAAMLRTVSPASLDPHGSGCPGSQGQSDLRLAQPWTRAWLGRTLEVELTNLPLSAGLVATGWSDQQYGTTSLPAPLDGYGMPGCLARVAPDAVFFISGTAGRACLGLPVPVNSSLVGVQLFQQGYSFDPGFNSLGVTVSNSVRVTIGQL